MTRAHRSWRLAPAFVSVLAALAATFVLLQPAPRGEEASRAAAMQAGLLQRTRSSSRPFLELR